MKCPSCDTELIGSRTERDPDGTERTEFRCPKCKKVFADVKIPHDALLGGKMGWKE